MLRKAVVATAAAVTVLGGSAAALAASGSPATPAASAASAGPVFNGCVNDPHGRVIDDVHENGTALKCPRGSWPISWNQKGRTGARGPAGEQGPAGQTGQTGPAGPSGVVSTTNTSLISAPQSVATGGSFSANKTLLNTVTLAAGTYLVDVNFKATPNAVTGGAVFPSLYVYNGPQKSDFSNNLFNVGSGALEQPTATEVAGGDLIDSYFSGSAEITVPAGGETLDIYAFGYDSDTGAGSYEIDDAFVTATALNTN